MNLVWEDDSKTLQSSIFIGKQLFAQYNAPPPRRVFGLQFTLLVDTLSVFAATDTAVADIKYPGPDGELLWETTDTSDDRPSTCTYARINCLDHDVHKDLMDYWTDPESYFMAQGSILQEAIDDLEWPGGSVKVSMARDPQKLTLESKGNGSLQVELDAQELTGFKCAQPSLEFSYKYKNLKTALSNIPAQKEHSDISTKVSIDAAGILKVTHMIKLHQHAVGGQSRWTSGAPQFLDTQHGDADPVRRCVVQFVTMPLENGD